MFQKVIAKTHTGVSMKGIIILFILTLCGCVVQPKQIPKSQTQVIKPPSFEIKGVTVKPGIFNPNKGEEVVISYSLSHPGKAIIMIFDLEMHLIKDIISKKRISGIDKLLWDGRDLAGRIVPDEAYFFTIEAIDYQGDFTFYDPTTFSGGEYMKIQVYFDPEERKITYELPKNARVRIRAGIEDGPLLKSIANWYPRLAGENEELWDGKDESGVIDALDQEGFRLMADAITLPENTIVTSGNIEYSHYEYKTAIAPDRPQKRERALYKAKNTIAAFQIKLPKELIPEPKFSIHLYNKDIKMEINGSPIVQDKLPIKIELDEGIKRIITEQRYEILCFVDCEFISEEEVGYSPYTWIWDTKNVSNGEHIITVNVCTLKGEVSSNSVKVLVKN